MVFRSGNCLSIRLAERWLKKTRQLTAYRERPAIIDELHFTDLAGNRLEVEIVTYPHAIECQTASGPFTVAFVDEETLMVSLPADGCGIDFLCQADNVERDRRGGILRIIGEIQRNVVYTSNAQMLQNEIESRGEDLQQVRLRFALTSGGSLLINITPRLGFNRYLPEPASIVLAAAKRWNDWFANVPPVTNEYRGQYYFAWCVMRMGLISPRYFFTREAMAPSKIRYVGVWQWDACFHALAYRHVSCVWPRINFESF